MAENDSTIDAVIRLEEAIHTAQCLDDAVCGACGDDVPSWLIVYRAQVKSIQAAASEVGRLVRAEARS